MQYDVLKHEGSLSPIAGLGVLEMLNRFNYFSIRI
jgi:hypothetical protein